MFLLNPAQRDHRARFEQFDSAFSADAADLLSLEGEQQPTRHTFLGQEVRSLYQYLMILMRIPEARASTTLVGKPAMA